VFAPDDTIVAIATPLGRGALGVVRLSGPRALAIGQALIQTSAPLHPRRAMFARILESSDGPVIDHVVLTWFEGPQSYTGEDVVEIGAHGSPVLLQRIVELAIAAGARLAEPGEFTFRAYLHGRLDLPQAEAVADLVDAVTPLQARVAMDQLEGTLTARIGRIDAALFDLTARLEASLDFPDEGFHFITREDARRETAAVKEALAELARDGRSGRVLREGRMVVIIGRPNAGKSSLFNALLGASRAIVTSTPGTTRDLLTERVDVAGLELTLVDTAGLRDARDDIEAEGVDRARQAQRVAALSLVVIDGSAPLVEEDRTLVADTPAPVLVVISKADRPQAWTPSDLGDRAPEAVSTSVVTGSGLAELRKRIGSLLVDRDLQRDPPAISNLRHVTLVEHAHDAVTKAEDVLDQGATEEVVLDELGSARRALEEIAGRRTPDDLLRHIFARFCIGK
jgi:tRNA modification GTPase